MSTRDPEGRMTVVEHLAELRRRLIISLVAVAATAAFCYWFAPEIIRFFLEYYTDATDGERDAFIFIGPLDAFVTRLKIATYGGIVLAHADLAVGAVAVRHAGAQPEGEALHDPVPHLVDDPVRHGAGVALLTLPQALDFLLDAGGQQIQPLLTADKYIGLVSLMILAFGLAFEFPVLLVFLLIARVVTTAQLGHFRRWAIVLIVAFAAVITPSQDPYSLSHGGPHVPLLRGQHRDREGDEAMTSARRPTAFRPRRDTREVVIAVLAVLGVLVVTVVLLFVLAPSDDESSPVDAGHADHAGPVGARLLPASDVPPALDARHHDRERAARVSTRVDFEARLGFQLDDFQCRALDALDAGRSVLVAAPTGSGKTLVAEYAIEHSLAAGGKAFYTTPLKALSNQKYGDLVRVHGRARVGLLTGDNSINGDAPIVVMTTEVLRNMIYAASPTLDDLHVVVLDEVHYLQDRYRGAVWEEVIVHLAPEVALVCLSATVSNAEEVAAWIETVRGETTPIIEERRPVLLQHRYLLGERDADALHLLPTFVGEGDDLRPNPDAERLDRRVGRRPRSQPSGSRPPADPEPGRGRRPPRRARPAAGHRVRVQPRGLRPGRRAVPRRRRAADDRGRAGADPRHRGSPRRGARRRRSRGPRLRRLARGPQAGLAAHHAGMVPPMKEAVEEAFAAGLAKVVFATETLALGINMPARSVVIEKLTKFTGERHEFLTPGEYTQLCGRAGRRGIDVVGYAIVLWSPWVGFEQVAGLAVAPHRRAALLVPPDLQHGREPRPPVSPRTAHRLLNLSFAQYHADREVVALERQLERTRELLERQQALAASPHGDLGEYRRLVERRDTARGGGAGRRIGRTLEALRPGDVVWNGARGGKVLVLSQEARRGGVRLLGLTSSRQLVRLGVGDFSSPPTAIGHVDLPVPYAPRTRAFQREAVEPLRRVKGQRSRRSDAGDDDLEALEAAVAEHPVAQDPERDARVRAAAAVQRLERDLARLERRVQGRTESLARQLDRVLGVLESWRYLSGWELTPAGEMLARLYTETDLLLAESIREGLLDGLDPARARRARVVLHVRAPWRRRRRADAPGSAGRRRRSPHARRDVDRLWRSLVATEDDAGLPETRSPDPGFTAHVFEWTRGDDLAAVLDTDELTGGDFVRHVKQCIDLLRQIGDVAPDARDTARRAKPPRRATAGSSPRALATV